uniref:Uncharacterized protein n=1 Tax=Acanthochromis polyacanthus TaxID=80966 RepID=A0A3Q1ER93_9TELE
MSAVDEELRIIILRALPTISEDVLQRLINKIKSCGLESIEDLKYVTVEDTVDILQLRKLLETTMKLETLRHPSPGVSSPSPEPFSSPSIVLSLSNLESSSTDDCESPSTIRKTWPETFQVPWNLMPQEISSAISNSKRPPPAAWRQMIRIVADEMRKYEANPMRSQCITVCQKIICQYPLSFADLQNSGKLLGTGYTSLLIQLKNRIENLNRNSSFRHHRSSQDGLKRGPTDAYGCTRYQPDLPPEETEQTLEQKRQQLEEIYLRDGVQGVERAEVQQLMDTTFWLQCRQINALPAPTLTNLRENWPYLFTQKRLYAHFELLTDIKVLRVLELAMEECGRAIVEFFKQKPTNEDVRATLSSGQRNTELCFFVIQLLLAHFSEHSEGLIQIESTTAADVERALPLPAMPRLIPLSGEAPDCCLYGWMVSTEGWIICEGVQPSFISGLVVLFSTFYVFNLQYDDGAAATLEFIQRRFIEINPERGTKAARGKGKAKKKGSVSPPVSSLIRRLMDFQWDFV